MILTYPRYGNPVLHTAWEEYATGGLCLRLLMNDEELWGTATVQCAETKYLPLFSAFVKDYSENEGMTAALIDAGIIEATPVAQHRSGYVILYAYRFTPEAIKEITATFNQKENQIG